MAIEGLGNTYSIPEVKKEHEQVMNKKKKEQKNEKEKKRDEEKNPEIIKEGRIDIRI
jgi:hypothetical protein